ncbi:MAG: hypothetical protein PF495_12495 [Spirochaetales bacterium]|jgi:hypothetical protein|nr:hypothetical protein [Spirochaetales bacterium]
MPDWTAPFTIPKYTTAEFRAMKAAYIAKHGYTITIPGLYDIIKLPIETPMTEQETKDWKARRYDVFSEHRLYEIREMKKKRKDKFLAMLASPAPEVISNAGAFMTAIDDAQDALFTIGALGIAAMRFSPPSVAAVLALPTGVVITGANALNVIQSIGVRGLPGKTAKRVWQKKTGIDPWSKKGRIVYAKHLIKTFPKKAILIQALQTTNEVFGVGLSLGPIVGLFIDSIAGPVRRLFGQKVTVKYPIPTYSEFCAAAQHNARTAAAYFYPGPQTADEEILGMMMAHWLSQMTLYSETRELPGWTNYNNIEELELQMPLPRNILTLEVMEEEGIKPERVCNWPHSGKRWALATEIAEEYDKPCQDFFNQYMAMHDKDWIGHIFKTLACDAHFYTMAITEGEDQVEVDYTVTSKICSKLLEGRMYPAVEQPIEKVQELGDQIDLWEKLDYNPSTREIIKFCENKRIVLAKM